MNKERIGDILVLSGFVTLLAIVIILVYQAAGIVFAVTTLAAFAVVIGMALSC